MLTAAAIFIIFDSNERFGNHKIQARHAQAWAWKVVSCQIHWHFGSAVRADFTSKSDIDLIVDFNQPIGVSFIDLADFLEQKMQTKVDLVSRNGIKPQYYTAIEKEIVYV